MGRITQREFRISHCNIVIGYLGSTCNFLFTTTLQNNILIENNSKSHTSKEWEAGIADLTFADLA